jgi:hypothetical protein
MHDFDLDSNISFRDRPTQKEPTIITTGIDIDQAVAIIDHRRIFKFI